MTLTYTITNDDLVAMNMYFMYTFPPMRKQQQRLRLILAATLPVVYLIVQFLSAPSQPLSITLGIALFLGVMVYLMGPLTYKRTARYMTDSALKQGRYQGVLGEQTLIATPENLFVRTSIGETTYRWDGFMHVGETPEHLFLFINTASNLTVPKRAFPDAQALQTFLSYVPAQNP